MILILVTLCQKPSITLTKQLEKKLFDSSGLVKKRDYITKITEIESTIPDINNLATKITLTTAENKIPSVNNLVNKTNYKTKITEIEKKT